MITFLKFIIFFYLSSFLFLTSCYSSGNTNELFLDNDVRFFIAKKECYNKNFLFAEASFSYIAYNNHPYNRYLQKSKICLALTLIKCNKLKTSKVITSGLIFNDSILNTKRLIFVYYIHAYNIFNRIIHTSIIKIDKYRYDLRCIKKSLKLLKKIKKIKPDSVIVKKAFNSVSLQLKLNNLYIADYYFRKKIYLAVVKRIGRFNYNCRDVYDHYKNYLLIRSYNELYLNGVSKRMLKFKT